MKITEFAAICRAAATNVPPLSPAPEDLAMRRVLLALARAADDMGDPDVPQLDVHVSTGDRARTYKTMDVEWDWDTDTDGIILKVPAGFRLIQMGDKNGMYVNCVVEVTGL